MHTLMIVSLDQKRLHRERFAPCPYSSWRGVSAQHSSPSLASLGPPRPCGRFTREEDRDEPFDCARDYWRNDHLDDRPQP